MAIKLYIHNDYDPIKQEMSVQGFDAYIWDDNGSHANYTNPVDPEIIKIMIHTAPDYKSGRDYLKSVLLTFGTDEEDAMNNVSDDHRKIYSEFKLGTELQRNNSIGVLENWKFSNIYAICVDSDRMARARLAETIIQNELPTDKYAILGIADGLLDLYKTHGIEGITQGDFIPGLSDYINSINGYEVNGLSVQSYTPLTMSLQDLAVMLDGLLFNGKYPI